MKRVLGAGAAFIVPLLACGWLNLISSVEEQGVLLTVLTVLPGKLICIGEQMVSEVPSPTGQYVAMVLKRDCGGWDPWYIAVALRRSPGILDYGRDGTVFLYRGAPTVNLTWEDERTLRVDYPCRSYWGKATWNDVQLRYRYLSPSLERNPCTDDPPGTGP